MKKLTLIIVALLISFAASAVERNWYYVATVGLPNPITAPELALESGAGLGWYVALMSGNQDLTGSELGSKSVLANSGGNLFISVGSFGVNIQEGTDVFFRIYNDNTGLAGASWMLNSQYTTLATLAGPPSGTDLDTPITFSGSSWEAVPEPATALLFGIGGMGAFIVRRNKRKAQEEADA